MLDDKVIKIQHDQNQNKIQKQNVSRCIVTEIYKCDTLYFSWRGSNRLLVKTTLIVGYSGTKW